MKTVLKILAVLVLLLVLVGFGSYQWAKGKTRSLLTRTVEVHAVDFPVPFPLDSMELAESGVPPELADSVAWARAIERGRHLVESRYVCVECHGRDFGGGVMVDDPMLGTILGPNITAGAGGKTASYTARDWDRIVRHGVKPDGTPAAMPAEDFRRMSDQELSDIVAYIGSHDPVDAEVAPPTLGPLGTVLMATGNLPLSADLISEHQAAHAALPPASEVSVEFGEHLAGVCAGCHTLALTGGPVPAGDPSWPPASNLTPHEDGLGPWTHAQFVTAMREGTRPDGTELAYPMSMVVAYTQGMTDIELEALWTYLRSVPAAPTGG